MRTWIVIAVLVVLAAAGGGGYYALDVYPQQQFRTGLDQALATLPPNTTATYKTAHYSVMSRRAVVTGLKVHGEIQGDSPQPFDVTVDTIETENPNLGFPDAWSNAVANPASLAPETALPFADGIALKGVTFRSAAISGTEDSARIVKLRLYPWALLHDGMPSWKELEASLKPDAASKGIENLRPMLRLEAAAILGVGYDAYEAGPLKIAEALPGITVAYDIRKMTGGGFDRGMMREASGEAITFSGDLIGTVTIDRVTTGAIDVREPMTRLIKGEPLAPALLDKVSFGRVEYRGITAQPPGQPAVHMGGLSIGPVVFAAGMPVSGQLGWTDFNVTRAQASDPRAQDAFDKLGLQAITVSFALAYDWDVAKKHISVHDTMLKVNELGTMTLALELANLIPDLKALAQTQLVHAKLRLEDASLADRLLRAGAADSGTDPAAFRQQIVAMVRQQTAAGGPELKAAGNAAGEFITSPRALTIELSPKSPVAVMGLFGAMGNPGGTATQLGLAVTADK
jgi:hypothetical protein